jgi:trimeric autotransporter adhesin
MTKIYQSIVKKWLHTMAFLLVMFFGLSTQAQIAVTVTNNTNTTPNLAASYASFAAAVTDLNAVTAMSGPVTLSLATGNENAPTLGFILGSATLNAALSATNTITITGNGAGTVLSAYTGGTGTPGTAVQDAIFKVSGADYLTIQNITFTDGNTANPATMEAGLIFYKASATDGCNNNTVQNCIFNMQRINFAAGTTPMYDGSVGIMFINSTATAATTALTITAASGASSNNRVLSNSINGGNIGIGFNGFAAATPFTLADTNNVIGDSPSTGNTILNYGGGASANNPAAGIRLNSQWGATVAFNTINNNDGNGVNHPSTLRGILVGTATSASINITNNAITLTGGGTTSQLDGISNATGSTPASNTVNINDNIVSLNYPTATGATVNGITNTGNAATINMSSNNVSSGSAIPGTGTHILLNGGGAVGSTLTISNNVLGAYTRSSTGAGILRGIVFTSPSTLNLSGNTVNGLTYTNAASTGSVDGIYGFSSSLDVTILNNTISNIRANGTVRGIIEFGTSPANKTFINNTVYDIENVAGYAGTGVSFSGIIGSTGTVTVSRNKVYDITSRGTTGASATGISVTGGSVNNISNNLVGNLYTPTATGLEAIRGISVTSSAAVTVYHNTVNLDATTTSTTTFGTSAFSFSTSPSSVDVRNNILKNNSTPAQEGLNVATNGMSVAIRRSTGTAGTVPANYAATSNNNLIFTNSGAGTNNHVAYAEGLATVTNIQNTVANLKTFMVNRDQASGEEDVTFISTTGSSADFLHINNTIPTFAESGGITTTIGVDIDNESRFGFGGYTGTGSAVDIGADEFNGISSTPSCSGAPATANALASVTSLCAGTTSILSLDVTYTTLNNVYQWQSSTDNVTFAPISGANSPTYTASPLVTTYYRCVVTCTTSSQSTNSSSALVTVLAPTYATVPLTESFETTWLTTCVTAPLGVQIQMLLGEQITRQLY